MSKNLKHYLGMLLDKAGIAPDRMELADIGDIDQRAKAILTLVRDLEKRLEKLAREVEGMRGAAIVEAPPEVGGVPDMARVPLWQGEHIIHCATGGKLFVAIAGGTGPQQWTVTTEDEEGYEFGEALQIGIGELEALGALLVDMAKSYRAHPQRGEGS